MVAIVREAGMPAWVTGDSYGVLSRAGASEGHLECDRRYDENLHLLVQMDRRAPQRHPDEAGGEGVDGELPWRSRAPPPRKALAVRSRSRRHAGDGQSIAPAHR